MKYTTRYKPSCIILLLTSNVSLVWADVPYIVQRDSYTFSSEQKEAVYLGIANNVVFATKLSQVTTRTEIASLKVKALKALPDGIYSFRLTSGKLVIRLSNQLPQTDVETGGWYYGIIRQTGNTLANYAESTYDPSQFRSHHTNMSILPAPPLNQRILSVSRALGWRINKEEIIAFPYVNNYQAYRDAIQARNQNALLWGRGWLYAAQEKSGLIGGQNHDLDIENDGQWNPDRQHPRTFAIGDSVGSQILTVRLSESPNGKRPRYGAANTITPITGSIYRSSTHPPEVGRMHGHVLVNALAGGGTAVPLWLQWGIAVLSSQEMLRANGFNESSPFFLDKTNDEAKAIVRQAGALNPRDWQKLVLSLQGDSYPHFKVLQIEAQAQRMVRFFYAQFGSGAVVETLQRLGSGQSVDEALFATTGLSESQFFAAWMAAEKA